jgi:hypothetical protein
MTRLSQLISLKKILGLGLIVRFAFVLFLIGLQSTAFAAKEITASEFSQSELDQLLAPIALYPDTVLSQILIAATYPIEVIQADRFARANTTAKGQDAVALVDNKDWDPSVKALVAFPDILNRMSDDVDWTQKLGDAFLSNETKVMDTIQSLRKKAYASGSLDKVQHLKVQRTNEVIVIEPAEERIVYVPVYDTRVVYGNWWWPDYPPVYWHHPSTYVSVSGFFWGPSIYIGPRFFYSSCLWSNRRVVVIDHRDEYYSHHSFYTSNSIISYRGVSDWRHEPIHRRGVAYYNNQLRDDYGSNHESYRDARVYRDEHQNRFGNRDENLRETNSPANQRQFNDGRSMNGRNNISHIRPLPSNGINLGATDGSTRFDRAEQLRNRLNETNNTTADNQGSSRLIPNGNAENEERSTRQRSDVEERVSRDLSRQSNDNRFSRNRTETDSNSNQLPNRFSTNKETQERNNQESTFGQIQHERIELPARPVPSPENTNNRFMRTDNGESRRTEIPRTDSRSGENSRPTRDNSNDDNRGNRFHRPM